jgi:hypothetical protein
LADSDHIFLSYSRNDLEAANRLRSQLALVGRDRVRRWVGAETQVALNRHFGPHNDQQRLPIFPVLLGDTKEQDLPAETDLPRMVISDLGS